MQTNKIARIIVTDQKKQPVGIITFKDFFRIALQLGSGKDVTEASALSGQGRIGFISESGFGGVSLAREIMTQGLITVDPDEDLAVACKTMLEKKVSGLVVKDREGKIGIISKTDIVQFLT